MYFKKLKLQVSGFGTKDFFKFDKYEMYHKLLKLKEFWYYHSIQLTKIH